jgi:DNA-binding CsgD family transcriptional regulator
MGGGRSAVLAEKIDRLATSGLLLGELVPAAAEVIETYVPFDRSCWHTVDPGTVLFTGSINRNVSCSGRWHAEHEYLIDDVNQWWRLARSGSLAGATSIATGGDMSRSARHRSHEAYGIGDELRVSFVAGGAYWGAAGFLRDSDRPEFSEEDVRTVATLSRALAIAFRRAHGRVHESGVGRGVDDEPGVILFDERGVAQSVSAAAERWIMDVVEEPPPPEPAESKIVQSVVARARSDRGLGLPARARVRTRSGTWLVVYATRLEGQDSTRTAVVVQPATPAEVAPMISLIYELTPREAAIARLCIDGRSTKEMAAALGVSRYTVQDHLKAIFEKTGVCSRNELVGRIFLQHYASRWQTIGDTSADWTAFTTPEITSAVVISDS